MQVVELQLRRREINHRWNHHDLTISLASRACGLWQQRKSQDSEENQASADEGERQRLPFGRL